MTKYCQICGAETKDAMKYCSDTCEKLAKVDEWYHDQWFNQTEED